MQVRNQAILRSLRGYIEKTKDGFEPSFYLHKIICDNCYVNLIV